MCTRPSTKIRFRCCDPLNQIVSEHSTTRGFPKCESRGAGVEYRANSDTLGVLLVIALLSIPPSVISMFLLRLKNARVF